MMNDPFGIGDPATVPIVPAEFVTQTTPLPDMTSREDCFEDIDHRGHILVKRRTPGGLDIVVEDRGHIKDRVKKALYKAATATALDNMFMDLNTMTHIELAAYHLAKSAALGDGDAITELFDRIIGKPTQVTENRNLNVSIDDLLAEVPEGNENNGEGEGGNG